MLEVDKLDTKIQFEFDFAVFSSILSLFRNSYVV